MELFTFRETLKYNLLYHYKQNTLSIYKLIFLSSIIIRCEDYECDI